MIDYQTHLIHKDKDVLSALAMLNNLAPDAILFVVDDNTKLLGSLTDGDVRRGLLKGYAVTDSVEMFIESSPKFLQKGNIDIEELILLREKNFKLFPVVNNEGVIEKIVNLRLLKSYLPVDVVVMAGGRGERLRPLTDTTPKPLLKVGDKPIIEHNIDRLVDFGIENIWISIKYLGNQLESFFEDGTSRGIHIKYLKEEESLGTVGAVSLVGSFKNDVILIMNSDLLNNINFESMYLHFKKSETDLAILSIPYEVNVPYAILDVNDDQVVSLREKPVMTYLANGGVYMMKKELVGLIPYNEFYNATDLIEHALKLGKKVCTYNHLGYWLDIGKHEDFEKAQRDIHNLSF